MSSKRILLLEDNPADARLLQEYLPRNLPFEIELVHCDHLDRALRELQRSFTVHLILSDLSMPDSIGTKTITALHEAAPDVPIIVLSGWEDQDQVNAALAAGAVDYVNKANLNGMAFSRRLRAVLSDRTARA